METITSGTIDLVTFYLPVFQKYVKECLEYKMYKLNRNYS